MNKLAIKNAIITGPTGAVGTSLIEELTSHDVKVAAVCRPGSRRIANLPSDERLRIVECSLADMRQLPETLAGIQYDAFFHLAWDGTFGDTRQDWTLQVSNIAGACDAVKAASELGCAVFVGVGSQSEYGHVEGIMHPDTPCNPDNGYGAAKLAASIMTRALSGYLGIRHEWCRILSLFGPGDGGHTLISQVIDTLLEEKYLACTKGDQIWDYLYSKDAARALRLVAERGVHGSVYCLGSGNARPLREYILTIQRELGNMGEIGFGELPYYPNQVMHMEADIEDLLRDTGFRPQYTFEEGIRETIAHRKEK